MVEGQRGRKKENEHLLTVRTHSVAFIGIMFVYDRVKDELIYFPKIFTPCLEAHNHTMNFKRLAPLHYSVIHITHYMKL